MPVSTPQPMSAALSSGMSSVIFTTPFSWTSIMLGEAAEPGELADRRSRRRATAATVRAAGRAVAAGFVQRFGNPLRH